MNTFELRTAANAVYLATDERTADELSKLLISAADKIEELEKASEPTMFWKLLMHVSTHTRLIFGQTQKS